MSREDLTNMIHAATHSYSFRKKLKSCRTLENIIQAAKEYGFQITIKDLNEDEEAERIGNWFETSKISPLKGNK